MKESIYTNTEKGRFNIIQTKSAIYIVFQNEPKTYVAGKDISYSVLSNLVEMSDELNTLNLIR